MELCIKCHKNERLELRRVCRKCKYIEEKKRLGTWTADKKIKDFYVNTPHNIKRKYVKDNFGGIY